TENEGDSERELGRREEPCEGARVPEHHRAQERGPERPRPVRDGFADRVREASADEIPRDLRSALRDEDDAGQYADDRHGPPGPAGGHPGSLGPCGLEPWILNLEFGCGSGIASMDTAVWAAGEARTPEQEILNETSVVRYRAGGSLRRLAFAPGPDRVRAHDAR